MSHIFCGHEYTLANLKWACQVEKENEAMASLLAKLEGLQSQNVEICTIPSTLLQEKLINIFVRAVTGTPLLNLNNQDSVELMKTLREMKNKNSI
jgi:hydroxyacylglutathione hydrolase